MAQFPTREADVVTLAQSMAAGLTADAAHFPAPPRSPAVLQARIAAFAAARSAAVAAAAAAEQATAAKTAALQALTDDMKADLRYAETAVGFDDPPLIGLGWGGRRAKTPLQAPGQCRALDASRQGEGWLRLEWKEPAEGGKVAAYRIERRARPVGDWAMAAMSVTPGATLQSQERGKEWEYRVTAVNRAGEGEPSNTVMAVL